MKITTQRQGYPGGKWLPLAEHANEHPHAEYMRQLIGDPLVLKRLEIRAGLQTGVTIYELDRAEPGWFRYKVTVSQ